MRRRTTLVGVLGVITMAVSVTAAALLPAGRGGATGARPPVPARLAAGGSSVTLVTGDRVMLHGTGAQATVAVDAAPRSRPVPFSEYTRNGDRYVVPADAAGLIQAGVLDRELFNVTGLVRQGYDDAHTPNVPLLVRYAGAKAAAPAAVPAGTVSERALPQLGLVALEEKKSAATRFWSGSVAPAAGGRRLVGGLAHVWLNEKVHATLDQSVPQIGGLVARSHGLTGRGTTVTVLDTGIDTHHPDFAGRIGATRDFTGKGNVEDGSGHGTHVASIVAGSGAASGGRYQGVAPDATLAVGKVLDDSGSGSEDTILAGMQWAAQSGARVVNMSLGGNFLSDGTDPLSLAVNDLTKQYGTLFVVAAGNFGGDQTVPAPAAADAALTVGSVSKTDVLSDFSSRGPRFGDNAVKPDIAAPGEDIVAARAGGAPLLGEAVGDAYQRLAGTSMATPHVTGSAALVLQQHPDWSAAQLKDALTSTATAINGAGPFAVGSGRVDVGRAVTQPVTATGSVSVALRWPNRGASATRQVAWHNSGADPVTLAVDAAITGADGQPAPAGLLSVPATVTVPAGGDAAVPVTVTARDGAPDTYRGILTARSADGAVLTRTAVSVFQEAEMYDLTVSDLDRTGTPVPPGGFETLVTDLDHDGSAFFLGSGDTTRLPAGRYAINSWISTARAGEEPSLSAISQPELALHADTALTLDARIGKPVSAAAPDPAAGGGSAVLEVVNKVAGCGCSSDSFFQIGDARFTPTYAATVPGAHSANYGFALSRRAEEPALDLHAGGAVPFDVQVDWFRGSPTPAEQATTQAVYGGQGSPEDLARIDATGKLVLVEVPVTDTFDQVVQITEAIKAAGARLAMVIPVDPGATAADLALPDLPTLPTLLGAGATAARLLGAVKAGEVPVSFASRPVPRNRYQLITTATGELSASLTYRPRIQDLAPLQVSYYGTSEHLTVASYRFFGGNDVGFTFAEGLPGATRTEYYTPGDWRITDAADVDFGEVSVHLTSAGAGAGQRLEWNKAVVGPSLRGTTGGYQGFPDQPWVSRKDGRIQAILPLFTDAAGHPRTAVADEGSVVLHRDGTLVGTSPVPYQGDFPVPDGPAQYRLTADSRGQVGSRQLWTEVSAAWTFRSTAADEGAALPLLSVRLAPPVNLRNQAPGGRPFSFPAYVDRQDTGKARVTSLDVATSSDDGHTWQPAVVQLSGDHWTVSVTNPWAGFVSLRVRATDADGNSVEQTILRGYAIIPEPR
jgi:subtilisin family serine protease